MKILGKTRYYIEGHIIIIHGIIIYIYIAAGKSYLLGLGPLVLGEQLVGVAALDGATDAVDTLVGLLGGQTLQGDLDSFVLFLEEIVVSGY